MVLKPFTIGSWAEADLLSRGFIISGLVNLRLENIKYKYWKNILCLTKFYLCTIIPGTSVRFSKRSPKIILK